MIDTAPAGARQELPAGCADLADLVVMWMRDANLVGSLENASVEFTVRGGRVSSWYAKSQGGRRDLEATCAVPQPAAETSTD